MNISHEQLRTIDNPNVTRLKLRGHSALDRATMSALAGFHAVSEAVAESWERMVGLDRAKIRVIPRGVDLDFAGYETTRPNKLSHDVKAEFHIPNESLIAISVGRVEPQKGHRYVVEAMELLRQTHPQLRLLIVGRPGVASRNVERQIADAQLADAIQLCGPREDIPTLLGAADMFVFPSLFEGNGGNAMIEAMAAGLPIVTTGSPPMTDLIPDESVGLLVERCDSRGLAAAIARLADDGQLRAQLGAAARHRAKGFLSPRDVASLHEEWYRELLADPPIASGTT